MEQLERRRDRLDEELAGFNAADDDLRRIFELEAEIARLREELGVRRQGGQSEVHKGATSMDAMHSLEIIEKAVASAGADCRAVRKRAEDLYDSVVERIIERDGCDAGTAHARAARDPIGRRAYAKVVEMQEREAAAQRGARMLGAYMD
ncbi:MAG: hypothetical protein MI755_03600 [Sphingomonadales bacterium]|nr:hypothetical protein [Sphingomonadales bacterium]